MRGWVEGQTERHGDRLPDQRGNPPAAANVVTGYGTFTRPSGSDVLVIMRGGSIVMDRDFCTVSAGLEESWSVNVWVVVAAVVGVPLIDPLVWLNVRLGEEPEIRTTYRA